MVILHGRFSTKLGREVIHVEIRPHQLYAFFVLRVHKFHLLDCLWIHENLYNLQSSSMDI
ncbi:hypothetical protein Hanom_Chr07g00603701 [Helianthus anomalus]